jgi:hypothetical protein
VLGPYLDPEVRGPAGGLLNGFQHVAGFNLFRLLQETVPEVEKVERRHTDTTLEAMRRSNTSRWWNKDVA